MSQQALEEVLRRASSDSQFRGRLETDFEGAIKGYELSAEEKNQLRSGAADRGVRSSAVPRQAAASQAASQATSQAASQAASHATSIEAASAEAMNAEASTTEVT